MKKTTSICSLLGVNQQEMAMLLGVSRSLWSLYELGRRDLPLPAKQLLGEMLTYVQTAEVSSKTPEMVLGHAQAVAQQLRELEYQQEWLQRKIAKGQQQLAQQQLRQRLFQFLSQHQARKGGKSSEMEVLIAPASRVVPTALDLEQHRHRQELLELEKLMLESKLRQLRRSAEDPQGA